MIIFTSKALKMPKKSLSFLLLFLGLTGLFAQPENEVSEPDYIKTIIFQGPTEFNELPIIRLGEMLRLEFDVLNNEEDDFYYVIEHFNYDWTPSRLLKQEFLDGFDNQRIVDYDNSFNTYQLYSHYRMIIPNQLTRIKLSGNYMIKIYDDYGELMFSRKFVVYEELANVGVAIKRSRDLKYINQKQSVNFRITSPFIQFNNPERTVKTVIIQNNNLNSAIYGLKPLYTLGGELIYKYDKETSFWAGNEYLYFENKDVRGSNIGVQFIDLQEVYHSYLFTDILRANEVYTYNPDINGSFVITALNTSDPRIEADYTVVHFSLLIPELMGKDIYIYGNFNNYALTEDNKMVYNSQEGFYEQALLMKQGFYNYKYVMLDENGEMDEGAISGNFELTENNYKVLVYYRDFGTRYDRVIGLGEGSSVNITN